MGSMMHQAGYIYYYTRKLYRLDREIRSAHEDGRKYTSKSHSATTIDNLKAYQRKIEKAAKKYHELLRKRQEVHGKIHEHLAGLARMIKLEAHLKL